VSLGYVLIGIYYMWTNFFLFKQTN